METRLATVLNEKKNVKKKKKALKIKLKVLLLEGFVCNSSKMFDICRIEPFIRLLGSFKDSNKCKMSH